MVEGKARRRGQQREHHLSDCQGLETWRGDQKTAAKRTGVRGMESLDMQRHSQSDESRLRGHEAHRRGIASEVVHFNVQTLKT